MPLPTREDEGQRRQVEEKDQRPRQICMLDLEDGAHAKL